MASATSTQPSYKSPKLQIIDDKSPHCIPFILSQLKQHRTHSPSQPFFIGLNGVQGAGKTTLVSALADTLRTKEGLETLVCSIDDLYLTHDDQQALAREHPGNALVQHRGEPGTHDMVVASKLFAALRGGEPTRIPRYDKSAYDGQGDRVPTSEWLAVNQPTQAKIQVVIFEGWCVGFRALSNEQVEAKWNASVVARTTSTLHKYSLKDLLFVNGKLREYDVMSDVLNAFIHIDAEETGFVYDWRLEQETALRAEKGTGMTDEQVVKFVDGYYPAYILYTEALRVGLFRHRGRQLRLIVGRDRRVKQVVEI